ncbi:MAG: Holliday junction branch migration protein RuvA [Phycisphaerae bacterium]
MICRLTGRVVSVAEQATVVEVGGLCYEVLVPASSLPDLQRLVGEEVTLFTIQYLEGNPAVANFVPRMIGFLSESDREFFNEFVKVKGVSLRKALRAMAVPAYQLAATIESGDQRALVSLPEIGKRTAAQIVTDLRGRLACFLVPTAAPMPARELTDAQKIALEILVQWGDKRPDAQRWITAAVEADPSLTAPEDIVRAAYRVKHGAT